MTNKEVAIQVSMEGKTHSIIQKDIIAKEVTFKNDTLEFMFRAEENPLQLNLNLANTDIVRLSNATYSLPEADTDKVTIDLNFFNSEREGRTVDRRVVFRKGTLKILELSKKKLKMTFD